LLPSARDCWQKRHKRRTGRRLPLSMSGDRTTAYFIRFASSEDGLGACGTKDRVIKIEKVKREDREDYTKIGRVGACKIAS
jgi:hypothetical protein